MTRRDLEVVGTMVVVIALGLALLRSAQGADLATAVRAGVTVVVFVGIGLTVNQVAARRRARRSS